MEQQEQQSAAEDLYRRYSAAMRRRAQRYVASPEDAEDVVSLSWLSLLRHLPHLLTLEERAQSAYLMRTVQTRACDLLRQRQRRERLAAELAQEARTAAAPADPETVALLHDTIARLLESLPQPQQQVVQLKLNGCRYHEIAQRIRQPEAAVRAIWRQAVRRIEKKQTRAIQK